MAYQRVTIQTFQLALEYIQSLTKATDYVNSGKPMEGLPVLVHVCTTRTGEVRYMVCDSLVEKLQLATIVPPAKVTVLPSAAYKTTTQTKAALQKLKRQSKIDAALKPDDSVLPYPEVDISQYDWEDI